MSTAALALGRPHPKRWRIYADEPKGIMPWTLQDFASAHGGTYDVDPEFGPFAEFTDEYLSMHHTDKHWRIPLSRIAVRVDDDDLRGGESMANEEWIEYREASELLGVTSSRVQQLAVKHGWKRKQEPVKRPRADGGTATVRVGFLRRADVQALIDSGYQRNPRLGRPRATTEGQVALDAAPAAPEAAPADERPIGAQLAAAWAEPSAPPVTVEEAIADLQGALDLVAESGATLVRVVAKHVAAVEAQLASVPTPEQARIEAVTDVLAKLRELAVPSGNGRTAEPALA